MVSIRPDFKIVESGLAVLPDPTFKPRYRHSPDGAASGVGGLSSPLARSMWLFWLAARIFALIEQTVRQ
jgi:hypothetical protein